MHAGRGKPLIMANRLEKSRLKSDFTKPPPAPIAPSFNTTRRFSLSNTTSTFLGRLREALGISVAEAAVQVIGDVTATPTFRETIEPLIDRGRGLIRTEARKGATPPIAIIVGVGVLVLVAAIVFAGRRPAPGEGVR